MSSDAEVLAPADAVGSVSGTEGSSGSTKLSMVSPALEEGFAVGSGFGPGPSYIRQRYNVSNTRKPALNFILKVEISGQEKTFGIE